jgi:cation transport ATPase
MPNSPDERSGQPESPKTKPSRSRSLNVADFVESDRYKLAFESREHPDEMGARLHQERADADHERRKEMVILWAVLMTVGAVSVVCITMIVISGAPVDNAKWATPVLTTIVSAGVGYMTGKSSKSAK